LRRLHPMMLEDLMHMTGDPGDPVAILLAASLVRDDMPWLYELAMEAYRAVKAGNIEDIEREMTRLRRFSDLMMRGPFVEDFGMGKESHIFLMELRRMLERTMSRTLEMRKAPGRERQKSEQDSERTASIVGEDGRIP
jgi:hypothetical protein